MENMSSEAYILLQEALKLCQGKKKYNVKKVITSYKTVFKTMKFMKKFDEERFYVIILDTKNKILSINKIAQGTIDAALIHPRETFHKAITKLGAGIIIVHNHPSGDAEPSYEDIQLTKRFKEAGEILGIELLDHIIIGNRSISMRKEGKF